MKNKFNKRGPDTSSKGLPPILLQQIKNRDHWLKTKVEICKRLVRIYNRWEKDNNSQEDIQEFVMGFKP